MDLKRNHFDENYEYKEVWSAYFVGLEISHVFYIIVITQNTLKLLDSFQISNLKQEQKIEHIEYKKKIRFL